MVNKSQPTGVLLLQLGTPDDASVPAVRRYLAEFLSDPRVIESARSWKWKAILHGVILRTRPAQSAAKYRRLLEAWNKPGLGMPLHYYTRRQAELLQDALGPDYLVHFGMRYGNPNIRDAVREMCRDGVERVIAVPMYPQYSATSTASALDGLFMALQNERFVPALRVVGPYFDHPAYLDAMTTLIEEELARRPEPPDHYLLSYHGIPQAYAQKGDPYATHCERSTQALITQLGWEKGRWSRTYQSLFGRDAWLRPYTEDKLKELARRGRTRVFIASPGFTSDCLETIDELGFEGREVFRHAGGVELHRCPCLNDHPRWIGALRVLVLEEAGKYQPEAPARANPPRSTSLPVSAR